MAAWESLDSRTRITACHLDIMKDKKFALLAGTVCVGEVIINNKPTAATNGRDVMYGDAFVQQQNRKQLRYLVIHENSHKQLRHCTDYMDIVKKYRRLSGKAMDYSINQMIEETDPTFQFVERPTLPPLVDVRFKGMGWIEILKLLLKEQDNEDEDPQGGGGAGQPGDTLDEHLDGTDEMTEDELKDVGHQLDDAAAQGQILRDKLAGTSGSGGALDALAQQRDTDWRRHLREFVEQVCAGDDISRMIPPNRRMLAAGYIIPKHYSENMGELIIAADTSGSMGCVYPVLFGEVAQICRIVRPDKVTIIWWDTRVAGVQTFMPHEFDSIATALKPKGGGGTTPVCVTRYMKEKKLTAKAIVWITDGYLGGDTADAEIPALWAIIDNDRYVSPVGKTLHISSMRM